MEDYPSRSDWLLTGPGHWHVLLMLISFHLGVCDLGVTEWLHMSQGGQLYLSIQFSEIEDRVAVVFRALSINSNDDTVWERIMSTLHMELRRITLILWTGSQSYLCSFSLFRPIGSPLAMRHRDSTPRYFCHKFTAWICIVCVNPVVIFLQCTAVKSNFICHMLCKLM